MRNSVQLVTYADRLGGSLPGLRKVLDGPLAGLFGGVHVLPFFSPYDGADAGFDPQDHTLVDPRLGTWDDLRGIGETLETVVDVIVNHVSADAPQFLDFVERGQESPYADMFLTLSSVFPDGATEEALLAVYRPRPGLPFTPFTVAGDPSSPTFAVQNLGLAPDMAARLDDRAALLKGMDRLRRDIDETGTLDSMDAFNRQAIDLLTSEAARTAFDLSREPEPVRDRYGRHAFGQRALLARRLVEAGSSFVTVVMEHPGGPTPKNAVYNWDSHAVNCHIFDDAAWRFPYYDQAVTALVEDLYARGLDKKVLLVVTGEFGRTPRIETQVGTQTGVKQPGRDHWPGAMSMLLAGGGMRTGQIVGATNAKGEYPVERPLKPEDVWATVYRHLGIDYTHSFPDRSGRPMPILPDGEPIRELLPRA